MDEKRFMELCIRCARCIEVCPYDSIKRADLLEKLQIGTPFIYADEKACYLCMKCPPVCPTGALNPALEDPRKVDIGIAVIEQDKCLNYQYYKEEETGIVTGNAQICSTCYNICPFIDEAIVMEKYLLPVITDKCTGCGICVEKCPTSPKAVNIVPTGMENKKAVGYFYEKRKIRQKKGAEKPAYKGDDVIKKKNQIDSYGAKPEFKYDFHIEEKMEDWDD